VDPATDDGESLITELPHTPNASLPSNVGNGVTLSDALAALQGKVAHFESEGLRKRNFTVGVCNLALSAFVIGKWPEFYWVMYIFKAVFMVVYKVIFLWYPAKQHYFFLDFCWITNGGFFIMFILLLADICSPSVTQKFFLVFFAVANGPLAWSVIALGNKLVFHNVSSSASDPTRCACEQHSNPPSLFQFEWTSTLFIHFSPGLACWGLHWHRDLVTAAWGSRFESTSEYSVGELFAHGWIYYAVWWCFFTIWMLTRGLHYPEKGYATVFDALSKAHKFDQIKPFKGKSLRVQICIYMALHLLGCTFALAWSLLMWKSFWCHTIFLGLAFLKATVEGSSWYLYAIQRASIKQIKNLIKDAGAGSMSAGGAVSVESNKI
jgi:hypothetical protein